MTVAPVIYRFYLCLQIFIKIGPITKKKMGVQSPYYHYTFIHINIIIIRVRVAYLTP